MRSWGLFLGGLLVWAAQFLLLYAVGSILLTSLPARLLAGLITIVAIGADVWLILAARARLRTGRDRLDRWMAALALAIAALSLVAVTWQGLPALLA